MSSDTSRDLNDQSFHSRTPPPTLLSLPLELRQQIYTYLIPAENVSHPLPSVGITSVSHRPPPLSLLTTHSQLTLEILDYFFGTATWKLIFSHAFNFFRVDPSLYKLAASPILQQIRKVEVVFFCDILLLKEYPSFGLEKFCAEITRRADRACEVLATAPMLSHVSVSWIDTTNTGGWEEKAKILLPLRRLKEKVTFGISEINGPEEVDQVRFVKAMTETLGAAGQRNDGVGAGDPAKLRMLAFDVRQEK